MAIVIEGMAVKLTPLKPASIEFDKSGKTTKYVDAEGREVIKTAIQSAEYRWNYADDESEFEGKALKSFKGKPVREFTATDNVKKTEQIELKEMSYLVKNEHTYLLSGKELKSRLVELSEAGKGLSFKYVIRGFKAYRAVAYYDKELERALMRCYQGDLRKLDLNEASDKKEIEESNVETLDLDAMEV